MSTGELLLALLIGSRDILALIGMFMTIIIIWILVSEPIYKARIMKEAAKKENVVPKAITALNELKSELTKQQVVSALQQTALDHIVGGDYEDLLTKNLNAELRAEERLQK